MNLAVFLLLPALDPVTFGPGNRFELEQSSDNFGVRSHGITETLGPGRMKLYPLPQSSAEKYMRLRPFDLRINPFTPDRYERQEVIGPYQIEAGRLWFGNNYYDGEGMKGVGAFGYFDTATRQYTLYSPPAVAPYQIGAILVEEDRVWLALDRFGEDISTSPGGLVQWNRATHEIKKYPLEFVVSRICAQGDSIRLTTRDGYALLRDGKLSRFLASGLPIQKFPPPPTHY